MAKKMPAVNANPLAPARSQAEWDAQGWAPESEPLEAASRLEATISIRFDPESAVLLRRAARLKGLTKSEFIRRATMQAALQAIEDDPLAASNKIDLDRQRGSPATAPS
jgi:hypothetical protein